jgi:ketosteroid isomerase-like protein
MDSHDELAVNRAARPGPNLAAVQNVWRVQESSGTLAAIDELMRLSHEDVELRSYVAHAAASPGNRDVNVMRGSEEIMAFYRTADEEGVSARARAKSFEVEGDSVVVRGTVRVVRPDGSFAESKLRFIYHFRDGLIDEISWQSRAGD